MPNEAISFRIPRTFDHISLRPTRVEFHDDSSCLPRHGRSTTGAPPAAAERGATPATEAAPAPAAGAGVQAASDGPGAGHDDWRQHLGADTDPVSSLVFRYPDGTKEQWSLPCSSSIQVRRSSFRQVSPSSASIGSCLFPQLPQLLIS